MSPQERKELDLLVEEMIDVERENHRAQAHTERWERIRALDDLLKEIASTNLQNKKPSKALPPYHETDEWKALVRELILLTSIEAGQALEREWPIWQRRQHFVYLDSQDQLREGEVNSFDLDNETIDCTTWPRFDFSGYVNAPGARQASIVSIQQLYDAEKRLEEIREEKERLDAFAKLEKERISLPLLADLLTA